MNSCTHWAWSFTCTKYWWWCWWWCSDSPTEGLPSVYLTKISKLAVAVYRYFTATATVYLTATSAQSCRHGRRWPKTDPMRTRTLLDTLQKKHVPCQSNVSWLHSSTNLTIGRKAAFVCSNTVNELVRIGLPWRRLLVETVVFVVQQRKGFLARQGHA